MWWHRVQELCFLAHYQICEVMLDYQANITKEEEDAHTRGT